MISQPFLDFIKNFKLLKFPMMSQTEENGD